jgi:hypothetical protein
MKVFSIDLASKYYRDFGMALLEVGTKRPSFPQANQLGLEDPPEIARFARAIHHFCQNQDVRVLLLDGPQGWRHPDSPIAHMRLCERVLNTPGKTDMPGRVKPRTYLSYITFSIDLFDHLRGLGWELLSEDYFSVTIKRLMVESFPSYTWRTLGLEKLPSKGRTRASELDCFRHALSSATGYELPTGLTHDQLQAAVVLPAGEALARKERTSLVMAGIDPILEDDLIYEGWIPLPYLH